MGFLYKYYTQVTRLLELMISRSLWSPEVRFFKIHLYREKVPFNFRQLCDSEALMAVCEHYFYIQTPSKALSGESPSQDGQGVTETLHTPSKAISGESPSQDGRNSQGVTLDTPKECTLSDSLTVTKKKKDNAHFKTRNISNGYCYLKAGTLCETPLR